MTGTFATEGMARAVFAPSICGQDSEDRMEV